MFFNVFLFNNNYTQNSSAVFEIITPINENNLYDIDLEEPFGPLAPVWIHTGGFHTQMQGGAFRLPNGNTLITDCDDAHMFEVTSDGNVVWDFDYGGGQTMIARAQKYAMDYLGPGFPEYVPGDVNFDSAINIQDILMILDMDFGYGYDETPAADYNGDGLVNTSDWITLVQFILNN